MKRGNIFIIFILIAIAFVVMELDFDNLSYEENSTEYLLMLAIALIGGVYLLRRNQLFRVSKLFKSNDFRLPNRGKPYSLTRFWN